MVTSARELFIQQGYAATTVASVARHAGVSTDLVYKAFGSKIGILKQVMDEAVVGDDEDTALLDRAEPRAMRAETDQRRQLAMFAAGVTDQLERVRPLDDILRSAAAVDAVAAELRDDIQHRQRREAMRVVVGWITAHGALREGVSGDEAAAMLWTVTSPEVHQMLRESWHWSPDRYRSWLTETLAASLLPPATPNAKGSDR